MLDKPFPTSAAEFTPDILTAVIAETNPGVRVADFDVVQAMAYGEEMVSTSARAVLDLRYAPGAPDDLPRRVVVKIARGVDTLLAPLYENEVGFYRNVRPELTIEAPRTLGGVYDPTTKQFGVILEDLSLRAEFPNVVSGAPLSHVESLLDSLAVLHAQYWMSPRFSTDMAWVSSHTSGQLAAFMTSHVLEYIEMELAAHPIKREMVQRLRSTAKELDAGVLAVQQHQSRLPHTLLHGDTHLGNTYAPTNGAGGGLLDWQLMVRGYCMHDVNYLITTGLSIEQRRLLERDLLRRYLDRLAAAGVAEPPSFDDAWTEYKRTLVWGVYIGWLTTPPVNYGLEINTMNLLRLTTAFEDHETLKLVKEVS